MRAIILAAGKGTRLLKDGDDYCKPMKPLKGRPLLSYVTAALDFIKKEDIFLVVGYKKEKVIEAFSGYSFVVQEEQLGTGHAVKVCEAAFVSYEGPVLIALGDMPMLKKETYVNMAETFIKEKADCLLLTVVTDRKLSYGRILRGEKGGFAGIVEQKDCTPEQFKINELNPSLYVFDSKKLFQTLGELKNNNAQKEYYLTDAPALMMAKGGRVTTCTIHDDIQVLGVSDESDLALCEKYI